MHPAEYAAFTQALTDALKARPEVLGLILLGSTAGTHHAPDAHSDHDFFVIVPPEHAEAYRDRVDWLPPRAVEVVHHHRDTQHGARVIYADGHLLEYAVFTPDELALSRNHHIRIAFDRRGDLAARAAPTLDVPAVNVPARLSDLLLHTLVAAGRHARGEGLAARQMLHFAAHDTLSLLPALVPTDAPDQTDRHNPWRRVECTHPAQAQAVTAALALPAPDAALELLTLVRGWATGHPAWSEETARAVEARIRAVRG